MDTQGFLGALEPHPGAALIFELPDGARIAPGYHVTEVMRASYEAMDCGGQRDAWQETIVQLKGPSSRDRPDYMPVGKFLSIYRRVTQSVPVRGEAELRLEYGDLQRPAVRYRVGVLEPGENSLLVRLVAPGVSCKPQARQAASASELPVVNCC